MNYFYLVFPFTTQQWLAVLALLLSMAIYMGWLITSARTAEIKRALAKPTEIRKEMEDKGEYWLLTDFWRQQQEHAGRVGVHTKVSVETFLRLADYIRAYNEAEAMCQRWPKHKVVRTYENRHIHLLLDCLEP